MGPSKIPFVLVLTLSSGKALFDIYTTRTSTPSPSITSTSHGTNIGADGLALALTQMFTSIEQMSKMQVIPSGPTHSTTADPAVERSSTPLSAADELLLSPMGPLRGRPEVVITRIPQTETRLRHTASVTKPVRGNVFAARTSSPDVILISDSEDATTVDDFVPESPVITPRSIPSRTPPLSSPLRVVNGVIQDGALYDLVPPPGPVDAVLNRRHQKRKYADMSFGGMWLAFDAVPKNCLYEASSKTRVERYKELLEEMFGPGDLYRGEGRKPKFVGPILVAISLLCYL